MKKPLLLPLLALLMAGCTSLDIPDGAVMDTHDGVPEATLWGWTEQEGNFTRIVAHFEHNGSRTFELAQNDPHGSWNLTILDPDGDEVIYDERPTRKPYYETVLAPYQDTFFFTWLHDAYDRYEQAGVDESLQSHPVAPGTYTAVVQFTMAFEPDDAFEVRLPITVA